MIRYKLYTNNNAKSDNYKKVFARTYSDDTLETEALAKHMSEHNTPYSQGVIHGVLKDMINCIKELVLDGKKVKLNDLAIFSVGIRGTCANTVAEFSVAKNVKGLKLNARSTGELSSSAVTNDAQLKQLQEYTLGGNTETSTDTETTDETAANQ